MSKFDRMLVTCEHGGNLVPPRFRPVFSGRSRLLQCHRGYDPGALNLARRIAAELDAPLIFSDVTRLLVDLNRSDTSDELFSTVTRRLAPHERTLILRNHYVPYRRRVSRRVQQTLASKKSLLHLSIHSFTPRFHGVKRTADVGLLFDPGRSREAEFCRQWKRSLDALQPSRVVRMNYPYRGTADGLTTCLRSLPNAHARYAGIELEVNQRFVRGTARIWNEVQEWIVASLKRCLKPGTPKS